MYASDPFSYPFRAVLEGKITRKGYAGSYGFCNWLLGLIEPTRAQLERHRALYGPDCVEIPQETRTAGELRASGLSVREIAHTLGVSERVVKTRLRLESA